MEPGELICPPQSIGFILTDPQSTGLEVAEVHRRLQGYSQPREYAGNGGNWEEKLRTTWGKTTLETPGKPFMEPPPLIAGEFSCLLPIFPTTESSGASHGPSAKSFSLELGRNEAGMGFPVRAPTLLETKRADAPGR